MRNVNAPICLFFVVSVVAAAQPARGSIPAELLRPGRGESARYPIDIVIGELGQGKAPADAYSFANSISQGFLSGTPGHPSLSSVSPDARDKCLKALSGISPRNYRIGGGREEPDGAVSFMVRFIGRDYGITGELYIRNTARRVEGNAGENTQSGSWVFDEFLLDEAKSRETELEEASKYINYLPYERFF
ncbi:MAG: hypothetical protein LBC76_01155 [Treponema sp.]|jgi:hypothetical protein|nr:hypothetical protein [Treponema sp.]